MKKRVFVDENLSAELANAFGSKAQIYTVRDLGIAGKSDLDVIDSAIKKSV